MAGETVQQMKCKITPLIVLVVALVLVLEDDDESEDEYDRGSLDAFHRYAILDVPVALVG